MSFVFSDTSTYKGLVQEYEREIGANIGDVSGNTVRLKQFTASVNGAWDDFLRIALKSSGTWQYDDSNQTDYPIITTNLVANQRDYSFVADGSANLILDIFRVFIANSAGVFSQIYPVDVNTGASPYSGVSASGQTGTLEDNLSSFTDGRNTTGVPYRYDKLANGIFLDPIPNYSLANGLKIYINREPSYFVYTDTTKKPGAPGILHKYFYLKPAADYARRNNLANKNDIAAEVLKMEGDEDRGIVGTIATYFSARPKDEVFRLITGGQDNK